MKAESMAVRTSGRVESSIAKAAGAIGQSSSNANDCLLQTSSSSLRLTPSRLAVISDRLDQRDLDIVGTLHRVRMATGSQLQRLHFQSLGAPDRQARRTLRRLVGLRVLRCLDRRIGGVRSGSTGFVYALDVAGQRLAGGRGPAKGVRVQRPWTPSSPFFAHLLEVTDLFVRLTEASREGAFDLLDFDAEPACWRSFIESSGARQWLKPDAFVRLGMGDEERLHFVEVDRATESVRTLLGKLHRYQSYVVAGGDTKRWSVHPFVTWLVPDEKRLRVLQDTVGRTSPQMWPLFQTGTFGQAVDLMRGASGD